MFRSLLFVLCLTFPMLGCSKADPAWPAGANRRIVASFPPIYCFAVNVAGPDAAVKCLLNGTGPHDFQPSPHDLVMFRDADLFLINGLTLEDAFAPRLKNGSGNARLKMLALGDRIQSKIKIGEGHGEGCPCCGGKHGEHDPHVWLGPSEAKQMVEAIRDELVASDPARADNYKRRAAEYLTKIEGIVEHGNKAFEPIAKENRKIFTFHDSMRYFGRTFDIEVAGVVQLRPGVDPDPRNLKDLVEIAERDKVRVIAIEPQYPKGVADTLLAEIKKKGVDAKVVLLDPIETCGPDDLNAELYERRMKENIDRLADAWK